MTSAAVDLLSQLELDARIVAIPAAAFHWSVAAMDPERWSEHDVLPSLEGESILALDPDLILSAAWSDPGPLQVARAAGIPELPLPSARSWDELLAAVRLCGDAVGEPERASRLVAEFEERRARLIHARRRPRRVLTYGNFGTGGHTSGTGTTLDLAIRLAGMINASHDSGNAEIDLEEVLATDPELFLTSSARDGVTPGADFLRSEPVLAGLEAVREGRILVLPAEIFAASSHRVLDAAEAIAQQVDAIYP